MQCSKGIFIFFSADVPVELRECGIGHVRNNVLKMCDAPEVGHLGASKSGKSLVTYARRAVVVALDIRIVTSQVHGSECGKSGSKTVASCLNASSWVHRFELRYLRVDVVDDDLFCNEETFVDLAVALRIGGVVSLSSIKISEPVAD